MRRLLASITLVCCTLSSPLLAQTAAAEGSVTFNYFSVDGFTVSDSYTFDDAFAARYEVEVPVPFAVSVPRRPEIDVSTYLRPEGGAFVAFSFDLAQPEGQPQVFLENLQFTDATVPLYADAADPGAARQATIARLLEGDAFATVTNGFENARIEVIEPLSHDAVAGVMHMVVTAYDPQYDDNMLIRAVIFPHPDQVAGYMAVASVNLDEVQATNVETLAATMGGRILASFEFR